MPPITTLPSGEASHLKETFDSDLPEQDGFESHLFTIGDYNSYVADTFKIPYDPDTAGVLVLSTPAMFDVSFKKWFIQKREEYGTMEAVAENVPQPIQMFVESRLEPLRKKLDAAGLEYEVFYDSSLNANRKPKILLQTCGHVSGAAYYYLPAKVSDETWPPRSPGGKKVGVINFPKKKPTYSLEKIRGCGAAMPLNMLEDFIVRQFIGLCLHPIYGGHFAFRAVFLFPKLRLPGYHAPEALSILKSKEEIRNALERFNYRYWDSGFRDFGSPMKRYSPAQMKFFGMKPADRWGFLKEWSEMPSAESEDQQ